MSFKMSDDQDSYLKIQLMQILWRLGYYVRPNVRVVAFFVSGEKKEFTDADVWGVRFNDFLGETKVVCSAKSGQKVKDSKEIFYLAGVKEFCNADHAIYVKTDMVPAERKYQAERLGVVLLGQDELSLLEKKTFQGLPPTHFINMTALELIHKSMLSVKNRTKEGYKYLTSQFWADPPHLKLIRCLQIIKSLDIVTNTFSDDKGAVLWYNLMSMLSFATCELVKSAYTTLPGSLQRDLMIASAGGEEMKSARDEMYEVFKEFLKRTIKIYSYESDIVGYMKETFANPIEDLSYTVAQRLLPNYGIIKSIPRAFDWILFNKVNPNSKIFQEPNWGLEYEFNRNETDPKLGKKIMKDIIYSYGKYLDIKGKLVGIFKQTPLYSIKTD